MRKFNLLIICVLIINLPSLGRERDECTKRYIKLDSIGNKFAVWSDNNIVSVFREGVLDGSVVSYSDSRVDGRTYVDQLSYFTNSIPKGSEISFHPNGVVAILRINIEPNTNFIGTQKIYVQEAIFPYQTYSYIFHDNGQLYGEGWEIIGAETEVDSEKVGVWKFYDENGNCELVDFSKDDIDDKYSRY